MLPAGALDGGFDCLKDFAEFEPIFKGDFPAGFVLWGENFGAIRIASGLASHLSPRSLHFDGMAFEDAPLLKGLSNSKGPGVCEDHKFDALG
jgi:hypothetical protein